MIDAKAFITQNLRLEPVAGLHGIVLWTAHPGSRLSRLGDAAPYWAYPWAGGLALAHHIEAHPEVVSERRVLDLGAGSGLVAIAAARAGARVWATDVDPFSLAAIALNAAANGVVVPLVAIDLNAAPLPEIEVILAGDVFYNADVAARMLPFLTQCATAGRTVLVGDPGRKDLPVQRLELVAQYAVSDVGDARVSAERMGAVYRFRG